MSKRLLAADPVRKHRIDWHEESDGSVVVDTRQDVESIVEANKAMQAVHDGSLKGDMHLVGRIPMVIYERLLREGRVKSGRDLLRWLEDPDNDAWKIHPGSFTR